MAKLIVTRGLPASGKTTYAKAWVAEDRANRVRVNRDDLRSMSGLPYSPDLEKCIMQQRNLLIDDALSRGFDVINDDTNLPNRTVRDLRKIAKRTSAEFEVVDLTDLSLDVCLIRNDSRKDKYPVPYDVIVNMHDKFIKGKPYPLPLPAEEEVTEYRKYEPDRSKPTAYIFDIDGTCAHNLCGRGWYDYSRVGEDAPDAEAIYLAWQLHTLGHQIIFLSGRKDDCWDITYEWLKEHTQIDDFILLMRKSDDNRKDAIVKYEIFDQHVRDYYNVITVFDDRDQVVEMWRKVGVKCYQVEYGSF